MQQPEQYYVTGLTMSHFVVSAERLGLPARELLMARGVDADMALQPATRLPLETLEKLMADLLLASGDEYLGFHLGHQVMPGLYGALSGLMFSAPKVREAIQVAHRFQAITAGNGHGFSIEELADGSMVFTWVMVTKNPVLRRHFTDNIFALVSHVAAMVLPDLRAAPTLIRLAFPRPDKDICAQMETLYRCPVEFDAPDSQVFFPAELLDMPINVHGSGQHAAAIRMAEQQLAEQQQEQDWLGEVRRHMRDQIASRAPQRELVARRLGISARTLDRRLAELDTSWQKQLDALRAQMAREYLSDAAISVQDIAGRLGFSDVRALQRRFRVWTGMTPSEYRKRLLSDKAG